MNQTDKSLLVKQAAKLTALGIQVEAARKKLKNLVERGVPYSDPKMGIALQHFEKLDTQWKKLEQEHLILRHQLEYSVRKDS